MDALHALHICRSEYARQYRYRTVNRQLAVARPDDELRLLAESSFLRAAGQFVPDQRSASLPARPLHRIREERDLSPVTKHDQNSAVVTLNARQRENVRHHVQPAP